jgi:hypothetical protein
MIWFYLQPCRQSICRSAMCPVIYATNTICCFEFVDLRRGTHASLYSIVVPTMYFGPAWAMTHVHVVVAVTKLSFSGSSWHHAL